MKLIHVNRQTKTESRYSPEMGVLITDVTYITKCFLHIPFKVVKTYRETYYGEIKECKECNLSA